ncbi:MAG: lysophospholipase [Actinomycetota bacterium]|nr:lysophospholipase [Actinomycetota bacterium]
MARLRSSTAVLPAEIGQVDGVSYTLWLPQADAEIGGGVVIVHGAGSCKENHHDFARAVLGVGLGAIAFDLRGHGSSEGRLDGRVLEDIGAVASVLRSRLGGDAVPLATRGSSMGGYLAIVAAEAIGARAVVAICPASAEGLRRGLSRGNLGFEADAGALDRFLEAHDLGQAVESLEVPLLLLHAEGDEVVPIASTRELARRTRDPQSCMIAPAGGHHRSIQHDEELQAVSVRFIERALTHPDPS